VPNQFGFRKAHPTSYARIAMIDFMFKEIDKAKVCLIVTIDLRKALDKVDRTVLIHKLSWYGINCRLIESLLKDRSQYVSMRSGCDEKISPTEETILGVPQGSCLSCVPFSLMIKDICCCIRNSLPVLYADDDTINTSSYPEEIDKATVLLEDDMDRVLNWLTNSRQVLNDGKTEMMLVGRKKHLAVLNPIVKINGNPIKRVDSSNQTSY
jgi:hypothetical protein